MDLHPGWRVFFAFVLLGLVFASGVHFASVEDAHTPYPDAEDLKTNSGSYVDEQVFVFGTVERIDGQDNTATIRIDSDKGPFTAQIQGFSTGQTVEPRGIVQVFGTWEESKVIAAENVRVVNPAGSSDLYKYAVSGVAALVIVVLFFRYWRMNIGTLSFEVR